VLSNSSLDDARLNLTLEKMANNAQYPITGYSEDLAGSRLFQRKSLFAAPVLIASFFISFALFWLTPTIIHFVGLSGEISVIAGRCMMVSAFVVIIFGINYANTKPAKAVSTCSQCQAKTHLEIHEACEFFVCKVCETYIRGKDLR
jgi:hypothetical protein